MGTLKILLVEDNVSFAIEIEMIVEDLGYKIIEVADNAKKALKIIEKEKPDLIIVDISLKGTMNGIEMVESVKDLPIAVIFITQYVDETFYNKAKTLRPIAYLVKPFDKFTLQSCIETAFSVLANENTETKNLSTDTFLLADSFFIKNNNNILSKVKVLDILYIEADGNYCDIKLIGGKRYTIKMSLISMLNKLPQNDFIRIHKSYIIQSNLITGIDSTNNQILIQDQNFPIGRTYKESILKQFKRL